MNLVLFFLTLLLFSSCKSYIDVEVIQASSSHSEVEAKLPLILTFNVASDGDSITLPTRNGFLYNATIDWGDNTSNQIKSHNDSNITHTYENSGSYDVKITGTFEAIYFNNSGSVANLTDVKSFGTTNLISLENAFYGATNLVNFSTDGDTSKVTNMASMLRGTTGLTSLDLSQFDTSSVTTMKHMFRGMTELLTIDVSGLNTSSVTDMTGMFHSLEKVTSLDLSNFDTSAVTLMGTMFWRLTAVTNLDLTSFDTSSVEYMGYMFFHANNLVSIDVSSFDTSSVRSMRQMFWLCVDLVSLDLSHFNTALVTDFDKMFEFNSSLSTLNLNNWDLSSLVTAHDVFAFSGPTVYCDQGGGAGTGSIFGEACN